MFDVRYKKNISLATPCSVSSMGSIKENGVKHVENGISDEDESTEPEVRINYNA